MSSLHRPVLSAFSDVYPTSSHNSTGNTSFTRNPSFSSLSFPAHLSKDGKTHTIENMNDVLPTIPSTSPTTSIVGDWGLTIVIFFLVPLFFTQLSQAIFPMVNVPQIDITPDEADQFAKDANRQIDRQYLTVLGFGGFGMIISIALAMTKSTSKAAILGLFYGSIVTIIVSLYGNSSRLSSPARISIIGVLIICFLFLPRVTQDVLIK